MNKKYSLKWEILCRTKVKLKIIKRVIYAAQKDTIPRKKNGTKQKK